MRKSIKDSWNEAGKALNKDKAHFKEYKLILENMSLAKLVLYKIRVEGSIPGLFLPEHNKILDTVLVKRCTKELENEKKQRKSTK